LRFVASISANIIPSQDLFEAIKAFSEKRKPNFTGN
jgi:enoyl-CoA hydratase